MKALFFIVAFVTLLGFKLVSALSYTKLANVACNFGSLSVFIIKGYVIFPIALVMAIRAFIGASVGAKFAVKFGSKLIKPLLIIISLCMALNSYLITRIQLLYTSVDSSKQLLRIVHLSKNCTTKN